MVEIPLHDFHYHESRQNSYRASDDRDRRLSEETPLLHRFPQTNPAPRSTSTTIIVSLLLIILTSGVVIGVYLLILQNNAENVLPPVEIPLQLVSRRQWANNSKSAQLLQSSPVFKATSVIVVQTDTRQCFNTRACVELLQNMEMTALTNGMKYLPYNFLVSSNGQTYEALGWHGTSSMFPEYSKSALILGFIGNYTETPPTRGQIDEAINLFSESVSHQYLHPHYVIIGKKTKTTPKQLFASLMDLPQWSTELSDM
ncbi:peptidoglycan-recognition protein SB2 isoform X2 [Manduca sexta]|uniref:peptidoglycan-recognition protein SB2 isoform X2 n=1 Tax=Manduca sexta TaxID=7130 RepID=UPI00188ED6FF|nr:peptidoglycan-recognition protein SB2 isoform X2 [Manduca sexta]